MIEFTFPGQNIARFASVTQKSDPTTGDITTTFSDLRSAGSAPDTFTLRPGGSAWDLIGPNGAVACGGLRPLDEPGELLYPRRGHIALQAPHGLGFIFLAHALKQSAQASHCFLGDPVAGCEHPVSVPPSALAGLSGIAADAEVMTPEGPRRAGELMRGDLVITMDGDLKPIVWKGSTRTVLLPDQPEAAPVQICKDAFGPGYPEKDVILAPDTLVNVTGWEVELFFGHDTALVPARLLVNGQTVLRRTDLRSVICSHILLEDHAVLMTDGIGCESLLPHSATLAHLPIAAKCALIAGGHLAEVPSTILPVMPDEVAQACFQQNARHGSVTRPAAAIAA